MTEQRISPPRLASAIARQRGHEPPAEQAQPVDEVETTSGAAAMTDAHLAMSDGGPDDLPRTFRRERDAQREAREREARERAAIDHAFAPAPEPAYVPEPVAEAYPAAYRGPAADGVVTALEIPFGRLVLFFLKALFAAIPAIILLGILLWGMGQVLTTYFPALLKMKILITFPN